METATVVAERPQPNIRLMPHQVQAMNAPWNKQLASIDYFIIHAGYSSGKTYLDCMLILNLIRLYHTHEVTIGIGGTNRMFLLKTLLYMLFQLFNRFGIPYDWNSQTGIIRVDRMQFMCIGTDQPEEIYGYNFHAFIDDEIDELTFEKALDSFKAINERTRLIFPDGRQPFKFFSSTAQGLRGLYQIINDLAEKKRAHVLIRGETITAVKAGFLSPLVFDDWNKMYTQNEKLAFLEGRFVSLTTGRVYYEYDESVHRLKTEPFEILPTDDVWVGQDLNAGFSFGTAYVKRVWADPRFPEDKPRPTIFAVRSWSFGEIGNAPRIMRNDFPQNDIYWYPDASGNEILAGYRSEMIDAGIKLRTGTVNPHIVDRVFVMNKMLKLRRYYLFPKVAPLSLALKVRQYDDKGVPEKGKGPQAPDHPCFAAGTLIATPDGNKPIETVATGDMVLTRKGPRCVIDAGVTGFKVVSKYIIGGRTIECTPDHPVLTDQGFVNAEALTPKNIVCMMFDKEIERCASLVRMSESLEASFTDAIPPAREGPIESITAVLRLTQRLMRNTFTGRFGFRSTVRFLTGLIFITVTGIRSTTILKTSNAWSCASIELLRSLIQTSLSVICARPGKRQRRGIVVRRVRHGIRNTRERIVLIANGLVANAKNVASLSLGQPSPVSALKLASQSIEEVPVWITRPENALGAERRSIPTSMVMSAAAASHVQPISVPVYDLTVEDQHEYFANGILVSNCDSAEYGLWRRVQADRDFYDIYTATRTFRGEQPHGKRYAENVLTS